MLESLRWIRITRVDTPVGDMDSDICGIQHYNHIPMDKNQARA